MFSLLDTHETETYILQRWDEKYWSDRGKIVLAVFRHFQYRNLMYSKTIFTSHHNVILVLRTKTEKNLS